MTLLQLAGALPAVIFPAASLAQLLAIWRRRSADGVSIATWMMVGIGNVVLFAYNGLYTDLVNISALLGAAVLNFCVAGTAVYFQRTRPTPK